MWYNARMIKTYTLADPKPNFKYGDAVKIDMAHLGMATTLGVKTMNGKIVGKASTHVIDFWLVEVEKDFGPTYPYKVISVPHVAILM